MRWSPQRSRWDEAQLVQNEPRFPARYHFIILFSSLIVACFVNHEVDMKAQLESSLQLYMAPVSDGKLWCEGPWLMWRWLSWQIRFVSLSTNSSDRLMSHVWGCVTGTSWFCRLMFASASSEWDRATQAGQQWHQLVLSNTIIEEYQSHHPLRACTYFHWYVSVLQVWVDWSRILR